MVDEFACNLSLSLYIYLSLSLPLSLSLSLSCSFFPWTGGLLTLAVIQTKLSLWGVSSNSSCVEKEHRATHMRSWRAHAMAYTPEAGVDSWICLFRDKVG